MTVLHTRYSVSTSHDVPAACLSVCAKFYNFVYRVIHHMKSDQSWVVMQ